jgi:hypothetical protein
MRGRREGEEMSGRREGGGNEGKEGKEEGGGNEGKERRG